ncbi:uncharacterized protein LOC142330139 [Lycorma delicatula]|uniref:uncharacterized protein LOC142330139 n=1 Tax=Lycorma delicatula TaxID=130591 RepID=UPI003F51AA80
MAASSLPRRQQNGNDCLSAKKYLVCGVEVKTGNKFGSSFANVEEMQYRQLLKLPRNEERSDCELPQKKSSI